VGQLVEARAANSGARAGYAECTVRAVQPDGRSAARSPPRTLTPSWLEP
jgi:hypothetical protein